MNQLDSLKNLAQVHDLCLSIYQPLRDASCRLANPGTHLLAAANSADQLLTERGYDQESRKAFLRPVHKLARTDWSGRDGSVVIFRSPGFMTWDICPDSLDSSVRLSDSFFVLPLLKRAGLRSGFWLLTLSLKKVALYRGGQTQLTEVELPHGLAGNLRDFEAFDVPDRDLEARSSAGPSMGSAHAVRFGTTSMREHSYHYLHDFFRKLDREVKPVIAATGEPLILAGVDRELAAYRDVNTCSTLLKTEIHGSPDGLTNAILLRRALHILETGNRTADSRAGRQIAEATDRGLLARDFSVLQEAARDGRIERLFVSTDSDKADAVTMDLLNDVVLATIRNSGSVMITGSPEVGGAMAAQLRYRGEQETPSGLTPRAA